MLLKSTLPLDNLKIGQLYSVRNAVINYHNGNSKYNLYIRVTQHYWEKKYYIVPIAYELNSDNKWVKCLAIGFKTSPDNMCRIHLDEKQIFILK